MLPRRRAVFALSICILLTAAAPAPAQDLRGSLQLSFAGTSTLHDFEGAVGPLAVSLSQDASGAWSGDVLVPVAEMNTGNGWRDQSMREMLDAARHPHILGRFRDVNADRAHRSGELEFVLRIRTVEHPVRATITDWRQSEREASFEAAFDLSLQSFQLEAPRTLFLRVGDTVRVTARVTLERA